MTPKQLFRTFALAEGVTWTLLLAGMVQKYLLDAGEWGVSVAGPVHGLVFLGYCVATVLVAVNQRWTWRTTAVALGGAVPPLATVPVELWLARSGRLDGAWRTTPDATAGMLDRLVRWSVARPLLALGLAVLVVASVFAALLVAGPPVSTEG